MRAKALKAYIQHVHAVADTVMAIARGITLAVLWTP